MDTTTKPFRIEHNSKAKIWQIYLPEINVSIAEFYANTTHAREEITKILNVHHDLIDALKDIAEMPEHDQDDAHRLRHKAKVALKLLEKVEC